MPYFFLISKDYEIKLKDKINLVQGNPLLNYNPAPF